MKNVILIFLLSMVSTFVFAQYDTYKIGNTEYYTGEYYSTTGKPKVKRSAANKKVFLHRKGYDTTPYGYEIDHVIPLSQGGSDDPSNMQLLTVAQHARKTAKERASRSNATYYNTPNYYSTPSYKPSSSYSNASNTSTSNGKTIYTGSRGGKYYINSNGKKTYIKSKSSSSSSNSYNYNYSTPSYTPSYNTSNRTIHTGSRGGQYYINSNGNKTYIKKD